MKPIIIESKTLPEAWFNCILDLLNRKRLSNNSKNQIENYGIHEYLVDRGSFQAQHKRLEFDHITIRIEYPGSRPLVPDVPQGIPAPVTQQYIDEYLPYLLEDKKQQGEEYTYGMYLKPQIPKIIEMYKKSNGYNTNQAIMTVGGIESIDLDAPPCLRMIDTRIWNNQLHFFVYFRSWDLWGGFPANLGGLQILKEYMASEIGVNDGELIADSKGLHLYDYSWDLAKAVLRR